MKYHVIKRIFGIFFIIMFASFALTNHFDFLSQGQDEDWSEPTEITKYDYTYIPSPTSIVVDSEGDWHIVYSDRVRYENNSQRQIIKYINPTSTEVLAEVFYHFSNQSGEIIGFPSIALDKNGGLHVTYTYYTFDDQFNQSVMYIRKETGSSSWSTAQEIAKFDYIWIPSRSSITIDSNGDWHIVYPDRDRHEDGFDTRYIKYKNKSSTETLAEGYGNIFTENGEGVGHPSIAIDPKGNLHVSYIYLDYGDVMNQSIMYTIKRAGSQSWSNAEKITTFEYSFVPSYSSIAVDSDGDWHIIYPDRIRYQDNSDRRYIKYKNKASTEILAEGYGYIFNDTGDGVGCPSIAVDLDGDLHVIYTHMYYNDTLNQSIMYTTREAPDKTDKKVDKDKDGLSDSWEIEYFGDLSQNADDDYDQDGFTNLQEYQEGSNPIEASSTPKEESILNYWWIFLIIFVIVALIVGLFIRKRKSATTKKDTFDLTKEKTEQTTTTRKRLPPPPRSKLPPPPPNR